MDTTMYSYTLHEHEEWVRKLVEKFGKRNVEETFRWINTIIEIEVEKSKKCSLTLTLDFGRSEPRRQHANIMCTYGTLQQIRRFVAKSYESWDEGIATFESLKNSSVIDVRAQFRYRKRCYRKRESRKLRSKKTNKSL